MITYKKYAIGDIRNLSWWSDIELVETYAPLLDEIMGHYFEIRQQVQIATQGYSAITADADIKVDIIDNITKIILFKWLEDQERYSIPWLKKVFK